MNNPVGPHQPENASGNNGDGPIDAEFTEVPPRENREPAWRTQKDKVDLAYLTLWGILIGEVAIITLMWGINIVPFISKGFNVPIGIVSTLILLYIGFRPQNVLWAAGAGGLVAFLTDRDKSQGIATGPVWLYRIVLAMSYSFLLFAFVLMVMPFKASPGAFWVLYVGAFVLLLTRLVIPATGTTRMLLQIIPIIFMFGAVWSVYGNTDSKRTEPRTQVQRPVVQAVATQPTIPAGTLARVSVPACGESWVQVNIPVMWSVTSGWNTSVVTAEWREGGEWKSFEGKNLTGNFDAVRYCTTRQAYVDEDMQLVWKALQ